MKNYITKWKEHRKSVSHSIRTERSLKTLSTLTLKTPSTIPNPFFLTFYGFEKVALTSQFEYCSGFSTNVLFPLVLAAPSDPSETLKAVHETVLADRDEDRVNSQWEGKYKLRTYLPSGQNTQNEGTFSF